MEKIDINKCYIFNDYLTNIISKEVISQEVISQEVISQEVISQEKNIIIPLMILKLNTVNLLKKQIN